MFGAPASSTLGERRQARPPPLRLPSGCVVSLVLSYMFADDRPGGLNVKNDTSLRTPMRTPISTSGSPMMFKVVSHLHESR